MNKMVKGSIAGAAGVALLMGSFGTYAVWTDDANLDAQTITAGTLTVEAGDVSWYDESTDEPITDIDSFRIVPGDQLRMTQDMVIKAVGDNIKGIVTIDQGTLGDLKATFGDELTHSITLIEADEADDFVGDPTTGYEFSGAVDETVTAEVVFSFDDVENGNRNESKNAEASFGDARFTVTQTR